MSSGLLTILGFAAGALAVAGVYSILADLFLRDRSRLNRRVNEVFRKQQRASIQRSPLFKNPGQVAADLETLDDSGKSMADRFRMMVEQSGLNLTPQRLLLYMLGAAVAGAAFMLALQRHWSVVAVGAVVAGIAPHFFVLFKRNARLHKLLSQLPDAFDLMGRIIRAGQTISQGLQAVGEEFDQPVAGEFAYCFEQQNLGLSPEMAMRDLARRTGLLEIKIFVLAMLVQQQSGGNLAELLDKLSGIIRERFRIKGKIKALTAEGRFQALILLCLPPLILAAMLALNRDYTQSLMNYPLLLVGMFVAELLGALWIRKIINFDY